MNKGSHLSSTGVPYRPEMFDSLNRHLGSTFKDLPKGGTMVEDELRNLILDKGSFENLQYTNSMVLNSKQGISETLRQQHGKMPAMPGMPKLDQPSGDLPGQSNKKEDSRSAFALHLDQQLLESSREIP